ncbi:putative chitinase [Helianthus anomalus]
MALTWATGVRFGRATRRIDRENEAHLSTNNRRWFGSTFRPKNAYFYELFIFFMFFSAFRGLLFGSSFWPKCVLRPVLNLRCYLYECNGRKIISFEVRFRIPFPSLHHFSPSSVDSWVSNAVSTLTNIIQEYHLDGIDIDYEHFLADPETFAECIGKLITTLKHNGVISFASIAPFEDDEVQRHYLALWKSYGHIIDYVNFQFYAYDKGTTVSQFMNYFQTQSSNYKGGKILVSPLKEVVDCLRKTLHGIFIWSADDSKASGFRYERQSQALLAVPHLQYSV